MTPLLVPVVILASIGFGMAALLAVGRKVFYVEVDERLERIVDILPGANCGGCGYAGCSGYAAALVEGKAEPTSCPLGGSELANEIGAILGVEVGEVPDLVAMVACAGDDKLAFARSRYLGVRTCVAAHSIAGGPKQCDYGCLGLGSCAEACLFDAIVMTDQNLAVVVPDLCVGCGKCVSACPRNIIKMVPRGEQVHVLCVSPLKAKQVKAACSVGCTGCKLCAKQSPRFEMDGLLARVDTDTDGEIPEHAALVCPQGAILDTRKYTFEGWLADPSARENYDKRSAEWKQAEKERKAASKKARDAAKTEGGEA